MMLATTLMLPRDGYGDAVFTRHLSDDRTRTWLTCERADPRIRISDEVAYQAAAGELPHVTLATPDGSTAKPARHADWFGAILTIDCANQRLVYRITGWEPIWLEGGQNAGSWLAEWPD